MLSRRRIYICSIEAAHSCLLFPAINKTNVRAAKKDAERRQTAPRQAVVSGAISPLHHLSAWRV